MNEGSWSRVSDDPQSAIFLRGVWASFPLALPSIDICCHPNAIQNEEPELEGDFSADSSVHIFTKRYSYTPPIDLEVHRNDCVRRFVSRSLMF